MLFFSDLRVKIMGIGGIKSSTFSLNLYYVSISIFTIDFFGTQA